MICFRYDLLNTGAASKNCPILRENLNINRVRTEFAKFYQISNQPRQVPNYMMIKRVVDRFLSTGFIFIGSGNQNVPVQTENQVSSHLFSLPPAKVRRAAENLLLDMEGGHLKHVLKKYIDGAPEEWI